MIEKEAPAAEAETAAAELSETPAVQSSPAEASTPQAQAAREVKPETKPEEPKGPKWFRDTLSEKDRRVREAERRAQQLQEQIDRVQGQAPQRQIDYNNPQAVYHTFEERLHEAELKQNIALSARFARREHGAELFDEAAVWLSQRPDLELWAQAQPDPWEAAITRFKQERLADEIGDDPAAYRERLRQELLAELQQQPQGAAPGMTGQSPPRLPQSAAGQRSAAPRGPITAKSPFKHEW